MEIKGYMLKLNAEVQKCLKCGKDNTFLTQADIHEYGVWIARNQRGDRFSRVQLIDNPVFEELLELIKTVCSEHSITDHGKYLDPKVTQNLFPIACDLVDGNSVSFRDEARVCRYCGSKDFAEGLSMPINTIEVKTFDVSYDSWNSRSLSDKKELVFNALKSIPV